ncbi:hypothetical protein PVAP13_1NG434600 [Panicum virgatum]|uniref:Uncharacterized protein n=1 Tax=Panicum virgatum TaxID=38727 RepID=A0A8T0WZA0_PANVG|nr:hypothetical protein PVAP13_1NG434600 [Panicum virgatum]
MPLRAGRREHGLTARRNRFSALRSIASCLIPPRHAVKSQSSSNEESRSRTAALPDFKGQEWLDRCDAVMKSTL